MNLPVDAENVVLEINEYPTSIGNLSNVQQPQQQPNNLYNKVEYFIEKIKLVFISSLLLVPFIVCCLYFALKNDPCIKQHGVYTSITLFDYLIGIFCFYTFLWIFDMYLIYSTDLNSRRKRENAVFILIFIHTVMNLISSIYSMIVMTNFYVNSTICYEDTKTYLRVLLIMNVVIAVFIVLLNVLNSV